MITFKQFLAERAFNQQTYRQVFKKHPDALAGFEVEVYVPGGHDLAPSNPTDAVSIRRLDTFNEFRELFTIRNSDSISIDNDHETWAEEKKKEWADENWREHVDASDYDDDPDREMVRAKERALKDFDEGEVSFTNWFNEEFRNAYEFVSSYGLEPKYGWAHEDGKNSEVYSEAPKDYHHWNHDTAEQAADTLSKRLKEKVVVRDNPGHGEGDRFIIVPDSSIDDGEGNQHGVGFEVVTPPLPISTALKHLNEIFNWIDDNDFQTNASTGLHINVSIPRIKDKLDALKLVMFMADKHVLEKFGRLGNSMSRPLTNTVIRAVEKTGKIPSDVQGFKELTDRIVQDYLNKAGKYAAVNLDKLKDGYLEFRAAGGKNYHGDITVIEDLVGRWMNAIDLACDPDADRKEYVKKLAALFSMNQPPSNENDKEMSVLDLFKRVSQSWTEILRSKKGDTAARALAAIGAHFKDYRPSFRQIKELKEIMRNAGITIEDVHKQIQDFNIGNRKDVELFLQNFKVQ